MRMIERRKRKATAEQHGSLVVIRMTGGGDCLWLNMYLDTEEGQMTCDSDIGFYAYRWGRNISKDESFLQFCCRWMNDEEWLLRKCIGERHIPLDFDRDKTVKVLREMYEDWNDDDSAIDFEDALDEAYQTNGKNEWCAVFQYAANANNVELPDEWWSCIVEEYTPWQKRFAEICREVIVPELKRLISLGC